MVDIRQITKGECAGQWIAVWTDASGQRCKKAETREELEALISTSEQTNG